MKPIRSCDGFCGFGGFRLALEANGFYNVFSFDIDPNARKQYLANFGEIPHGDIRTIESPEIPEHDILVGGFPCPTFSRAGISKLQSLGRPSGLHDFERGQLFFELVRILAFRRPRGFLFENVENLLNHDSGRTIETMKGHLEDLGYHLNARLIDAGPFVPQNRFRTFIVGFTAKDDLARFHRAIDADHDSLFGQSATPKLADILESNVREKYTLTERTWSFLKRHREKHAAAGNGFGYTIADLSKVTRTLTARYHKDGSEILVPQEGNRPRRLTPREAARLMGFPDSYRIVVSDSPAYSGFGNAVVVPVVSRLLSAIKSSLLQISDLHHTQK